MAKKPGKPRKYRTPSGRIFTSTQDFDEDWVPKFALKILSKEPKRKKKKKPYRYPPPGFKLGRKK